MSSRSIFTRRAFAAFCFAIVLAQIASSAYAQNIIEKLVSPGALSEPHREFEKDCASCHASFDKTAQSSLCFDCHKAVAADIKASKGFHGKGPNVNGAPCKTCHTEHKGVAFKVVKFDPVAFDHKFTDYPLAGGHAGVKCESCHAAGQKFREAPSRCIDCHKTDEPHKGNLGTACQSCHSVADWKEVKFDHAKTGFPLVGEHGKAACGACHVSEVYKGLPAQCIDCHREDDTHNGANGTDCASCHAPTGWAAVAFDHGARTRFALTGKHASLDCAACHTTSLTSPKLPTACVACHKADDAHQGRNGPACAGCHNTTAWTGVRFDHDRRTKFPLRGAHKKVACEACHVEAVTKALPGKACIDCHRTDDPHKGGQGENCAACHNDASWVEETRFDHDLSAFPLLGKHKSVECALCHADKQFKDAPTECGACHKDDDAHKGGLGEACGQCHNPNNWSLWIFDHDAQTEFPLTGAHEGLQCATCHRSSANSAASQSSSCVSCHRADDKHRGQFGANCERCHTTKSFSEIRLP